MDYLQDISSFSNNDNLGGLLKLMVARTADIEAIPDPVDGVIYGDITFKAGKGWHTWLVTHNTSEFNRRSRSSQEGEFADNAITFLVPKGRADLKRMFDLAQDDQLVLLYKDKNGNDKLFGTLEGPVFFKYDHSTGAGTSSRNGYSCEFYADGPDNDHFYNGAIATAPAGTAPAIVTVNGTFIAQLSPGQTIDFDFDFDFDFEITGS